MQQPGSYLQHNKYRIERLIGRNSINAVHLATRCDLGTRVIVKELCLSESYPYNDRKALKNRFIQEGQLLSELHHKYIVKCIDIFEENDNAFFVTEFANGVCLGEYLEMSTRFDITLRISEQRSIAIIKLIAEALAYLHQRGICHLDVKPSNVVYHHVHNEGFNARAEADKITLLDFASATSFDATLYHGGKETSISSYTPLGSLGYAPLELTSGSGQISPATDIYSLGATWYFLLTGQRPPSAGDILENGGIDEIPGASVMVNKAIHAAMNPVMKCRPQSISEFLALFDERLVVSAAEEAKPKFDTIAKTDEVPQQALPTGTELAGPSYTYVIKDVLGQGGFGITYLASVKLKGLLGTLDSEMKVAVKEFFMRDCCVRGNSGTVSFSDSARGSISHRYAKKFAKEALHLSKLDHPNIVKVAESFEYNNTSYYVMEYLDGDSLDNYVMANLGLSEYEAIKYIRQIGDALSYMHSHELLHMDVKPKNVMLKNGRCVLIDFGLAKQYDEYGQPESSTGLGAGTVGYAPLEQMNYSGDKDFAPTIDVYALGATFYKLLTAKTPSPATVILNDGFDRKELENINVSSDIIDTIAMAMEPLKKKRIQTIDEFLMLLPDEEKFHSRQKTGRSNESKTTIRMDCSRPGFQGNGETINGIFVRWSDKASEYQKGVIRKLLSRMTRTSDGSFVKLALLGGFVNNEEFLALNTVTDGRLYPLSETAFRTVCQITDFIVQLNALIETPCYFTLMDVGHFQNEDFTFADTTENILMSMVETSMYELIENKGSGLYKVSGRKVGTPLNSNDYHYGEFRFKIMAKLWRRDMFKGAEET